MTPPSVTYFAALSQPPYLTRPYLEWHHLTLCDWKSPQYAEHQPVIAANKQGNWLIEINEWGFDEKFGLFHAHFKYSDWRKLRPTQQSYSALPSAKTLSDDFDGIHVIDVRKTPPSAEDCQRLSGQHDCVTSQQRQNLYEIWQRASLEETGPLCVTELSLIAQTDMKPFDAKNPEDAEFLRSLKIRNEDLAEYTPFRGRSLGARDKTLGLVTCNQLFTTSPESFESYAKIDPNADREDLKNYRFSTRPNFRDIKIARAALAHSAGPMKQ